MTHDNRNRGPVGLNQAFDEVRFGAHGTLNLRESLPTVDSAVARLESWLRQKQVERATEVLVITGRGNQSEGGVSLVREGVLRHLFVLRRRGVIASHGEHTPGSFVVLLASVDSLWESPRRNRGRGIAQPPGNPPSLDELDPEAREGLRELAIRSLENLGLKGASQFVQSEMLRQFSALAGTVGEGPLREARLRAAIRAALDERE
jgi:hypothetical protein